jgi:hypothetical protein
MLFGKFTKYRKEEGLVVVIKIGDIYKDRIQDKRVAPGKMWRLLILAHPPQSRRL